MKLQQTVVGTVLARASQDEEGNGKVAIVASAPYRVATSEDKDGNAVEQELTASVTIELDPSKPKEKALIDPVLKALESVVAFAEERAGQPLAQAVYQARAVAQSRGEK